MNNELHQLDFWGFSIEIIRNTQGRLLCTACWNHVKLNHDIDKLDFEALPTEITGNKPRTRQATFSIYFIPLYSSTFSTECLRISYWIAEHCILEEWRRVRASPHVSAFSAWAAARLEFRTRQYQEYIQEYSRIFRGKYKNIYRNI